jgi:hypothetical protein
MDRGKELYDIDFIGRDLAGPFQTHAMVLEEEFYGLHIIYV